MPVIRTLAPQTYPVASPVPFPLTSPELDPTGMNATMQGFMPESEVVGGMQRTPMTEEEVKAQLSAQEQTSMPMTTPVPMPVMNAYKAKGEKEEKDKYKEYMDMREKLIGNQMERARILNGGFTPQLDLTPFMAAADSLGAKTNMAASYKAPETFQERQAMISKIEDAAAGRASGLSQTHLQKMGMEASERRAMLDFLRDKMRMKKEYDTLGFNDQQRVREAFSKSDDYKGGRALADYKTSLANYTNLVKEYGTGKMTGDGRGRLESAYSDLAIKYKEAAKLGALTGPDLGIIHEGIAPATGIKSLVSGLYKGDIQPTLTDLMNRADAEGRGKMEALRVTFPQGANEQIENLNKQLEAPSKQGGDTKEWNGVTYKKVGNKWVAQ